MDIFNAQSVLMGLFACSLITLFCSANFFCSHQASNVMVFWSVVLGALVLFSMPAIPKHLIAFFAGITFLQIVLVFRLSYGSNHRETATERSLRRLFAVVLHLILVGTVIEGFFYQYRLLPEHFFHVAHLGLLLLPQMIDILATLVFQVGFAACFLTCQYESRPPEVSARLQLLALDAVSTLLMLTGYLVVVFTFNNKELGDWVVFAAIIFCFVSCSWGAFYGARAFSAFAARETVERAYDEPIGGAPVVLDHKGRPLDEEKRSPSPSLADGDDDDEDSDAVPLAAVASLPPLKSVPLIAPPPAHPAASVTVAVTPPSSATGPPSSSSSSTNTPGGVLHAAPPS